MKKIYSLLCTALLLLGLTACEDVPAPYEINEDGPTDDKELLSETFASSLGKFQNITTEGGIEWVNSYSCATATGYDNSTKTNTPGVCYLVSPEVNLEGVDSAHISYDYILRYLDKDEYQQLLIIESENYSTTGIATCPWTTVFAAHEEGSDYTTFAKADVNVPQEFYGKKVRFALRFQAGTKSATWEVKNFKVQRGTAGDGPNPGPADEPKGSGTADDPYNIAAVRKLFADGNIPTGEIYFRGIVSKVKEVNTDFGNATYYVSDDGQPANDFYVYRSKYLNKANFTSADQLLVGDTVIVCGKVTLYNTTPETEQNNSYLYWTSNGGGTPTPPTPGPAGDPKGKGTADDPYNIAAVLKLFADGNIPTSEIYFRGIVSKVKEVSTSFGNATYYVSDDGKPVNDFYVYRSKYLDNADFTSTSQLLVGDTVIVCGKVTLYNTTPETEQNNSYLYWTSNDGTTPTPPTPGPGSLTDFANGDFETWEGDLPTGWKSSTTASSATLHKSTDAHGGSYSVMVEGASANKRLAYRELTLEAGDYTITFYAKGESGNSAASARPGYVPVTDGKVGTYAYGDYTNDITDAEWVQVTHSFTLTATTTVNFVIMNPKNCGNLLIDDFTISKASSSKARKATGARRK